MKKGKINKSALVSILVCAVLVVIGIVRVMSYSHGTFWGGLAGESFLSFLAYKPDSYTSTHFFKILATPSIVAAIYFLVRVRNRAYHKTSPLSYEKHGGRMDFESRVLRLAITAVISLHWAVMEIIKYRTEDFYPFSPAENPAVNALVLLAGWALAFWGMKYLSFEPLVKESS